MPHKETLATVKLLLGAGIFECIAGAYWWLTFSLSPDFGQRADLILCFGGLIPLGLAWVARSHPIFAACSAFLAYTASLLFLHWRGLGIVVPSATEYFLQGVPLLFLLISVITAFRSHTHGAITPHA